MSITIQPKSNTSKYDIMFKALCNTIMRNGSSTENEKVRPKYKDGTPAHSKFITQYYEEYDLEFGDLPIMTLRPIAWKSAIKEILWIYQDQTSDLNVLKNKYNIHWWDEWDVGDGTIGQRYGATVRRYDLMNKLLKGLKEDPYGRRHIINLYQYQDFEETEGLHPCAMETHWSVRDGRLDMTLIQRSGDIPVANAINSFQYVALQMIVAQAVGLKVGKFCHFVQNAHIYDRHFDTVKELINREGQKDAHLIKFSLDTDKTDFYSFTIDDFKLENYKPQQPQVSFEMAI